MVTLSFGNLPVDMRLAEEGFGMAPVEAGLDFFGAYEPIDAVALVDTASYLELRAWDASYHYTTMSLWITSQTSSSISISRLGIKNDSTGFYAEFSGAMRLDDSGYFWGTATGFVLKNKNTGQHYLSASGFSLSLSDDMPDGDSMTELIAELAGNDSIVGGTGSDYLLGFGGNDIIRGNAGNDTIDGGLGSDSMYGGTGNDTFLVNSASDVVVELAGQGTDTIRATLSYSLVDTDGSGGSGGNVENLTLLGAAANASGNGLANLLVGNALANVLNGAAGADRMLGGAGNDTYIVDNLGDRVYETTSITSATNAGGVDLVKTSVSLNLSAYAGVSFVENLLLNSSGSINGVGNALNNVLYAGVGNNVLNGAAGVDTVSYAYGVKSGVGVKVTLALTTAQSTGGSGTDTLLGIERLVGSAYADALTGNSASNMLTGGGGRDVLRGNGGNDVFDFNALAEMGTTSTTWDVITDFNAGDRIDLSTLDANTATSANDAFSATFVSTFTRAGQLKFAGGVLYGNVDADSTPEFAIALTGVTSLSASAIAL